MKKFPLILGVVVGAIAIVGVFLILNQSHKNQVEEYFSNPETGDIYVLNADEVYAAIRIHSIEKEVINFHQYSFTFVEAIPDLEDFLEDEWDTQYIASYRKQDLRRMWEGGTIVEIYRD